MDLLRLFLRPCLVVGIPVTFAILRLADVMPSRRFHENPNVFMISPFLMFSSIITRRAKTVNTQRKYCKKKDGSFAVFFCFCEVVEEFLNGRPVITVEFGECENEAFADACVIIIK